jgi:hypothetical protein
MITARRDRRGFRCERRECLVRTGPRRPRRGPNVEPLTNGVIFLFAARLERAVDRVRNEPRRSRRRPNRPKIFTVSLYLEHRPVRTHRNSVTEVTAQGGRSRRGVRNGPRAPRRNASLYLRSRPGATG